MKVLHIIASLDPAGGGPAEGVKQYSLHMPKYGDSVEILCLDDPSEDFLKQYDVPVWAMGPSVGVYSFGIKIIKWLWKNHKNYDFFIVNGVWQFNALAAWTVLKLRGRKYGVFTHGMLDPWFKNNYPLKHFKKLIYWLISNRFLFSNASAVFFTCEEEKILARNVFPYYSPREVVICYGCKRPDIMSSGQAQMVLNQLYPNLIDEPYLLYLGRIHEKKGCDLLLESFSKISSPSSRYKLVMAGPVDPVYRKKLEENILSEYANSKIIWTGMVSGDLKAALFTKADAFILPSHQENFGIAVAEALAYSVPVLISNKVNIWREIVDAGAGISEEDNIDGVNSLIGKYMALNDAEKDKMREAALKLFDERFDFSSAALDLHEKIKMVIEA